MRVHVDLGRIQQTQGRDYVIRFIFGGLITALAGFLTHQYGSGLGGLFLAFPAILPAALTLIKRHDGQQAAVADTLGAMMGSIGLVAFGLVVWQLAPQLGAWKVLSWSTTVWIATSIILWLMYWKTK